MTCPCIDYPITETDFGHGVTVLTTNVDGCDCPPIVIADLGHYVRVDTPGTSHELRQHDVRAHATALVKAQDWIDGSSETGLNSAVRGAIPGVNASETPK